MKRTVGTVVRGLRAPIIKEGDDIVEIVVDTILDASKEEGFEVSDRDIIALTESIVARAQGNYASIDDIATDVKSHFKDQTVGVLFPYFKPKSIHEFIKRFCSWG
jgi:Uncharacterized conserved protein